LERKPSCGGDLGGPWPLKICASSKGAAKESKAKAPDRKGKQADIGRIETLAKTKADPMSLKLVQQLS
jgi:hypothetical protein